ncbi:MAG: AsnC family transcriptional regulator [Woeseiaceae bacterium]|nr:AsnC family transcriptional regulator [Woeseiaceae bacterium]|tara:strand:+ start:55 stop:510 length:456 start_codon:yes stop_codon:yes gene_type:complete
MDHFDKRLLSILQTNGRMSNVELSDAVNLSESACLRRVKSLEERGFIDKYVALLDQKKAGLTDTVFVHIVLKREEKSELLAFEEAVKKIPEILECYLMTGEFDYLLHLVVANMADFERLHNESLTQLPGVSRVNSSFAIRTVQKTTALPID